MTDDLVAFLRARLDEVEQTARGAATHAAAAIGEHVHKIGAADGRAYDGTWWTNDYDHVFARDPRPGRKLQGMVADCGYGAMDLTAHIAEHDPHRVLRDVEADRALLAEYERVADMDTDDPEPEFASGRAAGLGLAVRHRAVRFADHRDYQEAWRP